MNILVTNCGSSSLKCRLFDRTQALLASGSVESLGGSGGATLRCRVGDHEEQREIDVSDHAPAFDALAEVMMKLAFGASADVTRIDAVGHRVVHGGERFREATAIDDGVEAQIEALTPLAPLHNPLCLTGIRVARKRFPEAHHVAVFDTAFHQTLPEDAFLYALPYDCYTRDGVRRYGFHGSSHRSVSERAIEWLGRGAAGTRIIT
ncbi:MAG: acetate kinase, partial [bacterium]|nr:acetate kinase [bacterium]